MGDSVSAPNPAYGQGITKAVVEAQLLDELLFKRRGRRGPGFEKAFYRVQQAWIAHWYAAAAETDPVVLRCGLEISQAVVPDYTALSPNIVARVLRHHLRPR